MTRWSVVAAGVLLGLAYTLSSLTIVFAILLAPLFWWAGRGLGQNERRWVFGVLAGAIVLRVAAIGVLLLLSDPVHQPFNAYFPDARFVIARSWWIRNIWLDVPIGPLYYIGTYNPYGASSFSYVLGAIQLIVGRSPYGLNFISVMAFLVAAIALYRMVRASYGPTAAFVGFAILAFWPTTFAWSVSALKESMQFALTAVLFVCAVRAARSDAWRARAVALVAALAAVYAIGTLRSGAMAIVVIGVAAGVAGRVLTVRRSVAIASALGLIVATAAFLSRPAIQGQMLDIVRVAAKRQLGNVETTGYGYKVLDQRFYSGGMDVIDSMTADEAGRFIVRAVLAFFLVPMPWQIVSRSGLAFLPQQLVWYLLAALGAPGILAGWRRDPLVTWMFVAYIGAGVAVIAPNSGNVGTLVRHRDTIVLGLVWLSAAGLVSALARARPRPARVVLDEFTRQFSVRAS